MDINLQTDIEIEPGLLTNFIKYWSARKLRPFSRGKSDEITKDIDRWLKLIESNHIFREKYGEDLAEALVRMIDNTEEK